MTTEFVVSDLRIMHEYGAGFTVSAHVETIGAAESIDELRRSIKDDRAKMTLSTSVKKRSIDANAYAWVLIDKIAARTRVPKTDVYRNFIRDVGGNSTIVCVQDKAVEQLISGWCKNGLGWQAETSPSKLEGCTNVVLYYGSSTYDSEQMSRLIDLIVQEARDLGIETLTPDDLERMKVQWKAA